MKKRMPVFFLVLMVMTLVACTKNKPFPVYSLTYEIDVINTQPFNVEYHSDLYHASGELKTIAVNADTSDLWPYTLWWGTRTSATEDTEYYIRVDFPSYSNPNAITQGIRVYANDTTLIDEVNFTTDEGPFILSGNIPEL